MAAFMQSTDDLGAYIQNGSSHASTDRIFKQNKKSINFVFDIKMHPHKETFNHLSSLHIFPALLPSIDFQYFYDKRPVGGQSESIKE